MLSINVLGLILADNEYSLSLSLFLLSFFFIYDTQSSYRGIFFSIFIFRKQQESSAFSNYFLFMVSL